MVLFSKIYHPLKTYLRREHQRIMPLIPKDWIGKKTFDDLHFYICLTGLPLILYITYCNIFIGPAELTEIPEGYIPKEYEYYRSPVSRQLIRLFGHDYQMVHEHQLYYVAHATDKVKRSYAWDLYDEIQEKYRDSNLAWNVPYSDKYIKSQVETDKFLNEKPGSNYGFFN